MDAMRALLCADRAYPELQEWMVRVRAREKRAASFEEERARGVERNAKEARRLGAIARGVMPYCTAWRQTVGGGRGACEP